MWYLTTSSRTRKRSLGKNMPHYSTFSRIEGWSLIRRSLFKSLKTWNQSKWIRMILQKKVSSLISTSLIDRTDFLIENGKEMSFWHEICSKKRLTSVLIPLNSSHDFTNFLVKPILLIKDINLERSISRIQKYRLMFWIQIMEWELLKPLQQLNF